MANNANSVVKDLFIEEMVSSGRTIEEAEQDWLQYLEDMADYRAHKYGNGYALHAECVEDVSDYPSDEEFWGTPDEIEYDLDMEARSKWALGGDIHPSWNQTDGKAADREADREFELDDTIPF